jgi:hypothetical protein
VIDQTADTSGKAADVTADAAKATVETAKDVGQGRGRTITEAASSAWAVRRSAANSSTRSGTCLLFSAWRAATWCTDVM